MIKFDEHLLNIISICVHVMKQKQTDDRNTTPCKLKSESVLLDVWAWQSEVTGERPTKNHANLGRHEYAI